MVELFSWLYMMDTADEWRRRGYTVRAPIRREDAVDPMRAFYDVRRMEYVVLGQLSLDLVLRDLSFPHIERGTQLELI